ncbi:CwfJ C-terminus 1-domain-containing protein-like protein [Lipomyces japonicus]|uniref:CwfJ C-terminus 1-domain-containing protein-like protein n=1 Tax=Lipomyces japonicus TaxID=56871 RepID=UPI0034CD29A1
MTSKILVFGSPALDLRNALAKADQINSSAAGPFDALFLLGQVFRSDTSDELIELVLSKKLTPSLPTYFYSSKYIPPQVKKAIASNGQLSENLICLQSSGTIVTKKGAKISAISSYASSFELEKLKVQNDVDVLITDHFPLHIDLLSDSAKGKEAILSTKKDMKIGEVATILQPRYHFSPGPVFWEREPFKNEGFLNNAPAGERYTRFISIAPFANSEKQKWFYAFNITVPFQPTDPPANTTPNPYIEGSKIRAAEARNDPSSQADEEEDLIWGTGIKRKNEDDNQERQFKRKEKPKRGQNQPRPTRQPVDPSTCFFCLANPQLAQHFIVSIGEDSYVTTAKGPLPKSNSNSLDCPAHVIIIPLSHGPTISSIEDEESRIKTRKEMTKYKERISEMLAKHGYSAIALEISRYNGIHFHVQIIPVPSDKLDKVKPEFEKASQINGYKLEEREDSSEIADAEEDFFKVYLPGGKVLYILLSNDMRFDLQFGRKVLANVLGFPDRFDWKKCVQTEQEEVNDAERFKTLFSEFDFTLE